MPRRFQFSLKWLFVAILVVAALFGGMAIQRQLDEPTYALRRWLEETDNTTIYRETIIDRNGKEWTRLSIENK
jgi:hypothetical protein